MEVSTAVFVYGAIRNIAGVRRGAVTYGVLLSTRTFIHTLNGAFVTV